MLFLSFSRQNARIYIAVLSFFTSSSVLLFLFRDSLAALKQSPDAQLELVRARSKATAKALEIWQSWDASTKALEPDPPPPESPFGDVVIAAQESTDLSWDNITKLSWNVLEYDANQPDNPDSRLRFPKRKGNEAVVYLSYIIDTYETLPWCSFFVHGHSESWHQEDRMATLIENLDRQQLARYGYISLRCEWFPSCPGELSPRGHDALAWGADPQRVATEAAVGGNWKMLFPDEELPEILASPCCAQFAVTRQAIRRRSKEDYERLRRWLLGSLLDNDLSGRVFEKLWAYIFTGNAIHCPPPQQCASCRETPTNIQHPPHAHFHSTTTSTPIDRSMAHDELLKRTLHVEVCLTAGNTWPDLLTAVCHAVSERLRQDFERCTVGQDITDLDGLLHGEWIESIKIADYTGPENRHGMCFLKAFELDVKAYQLKPEVDNRPRRSIKQAGDDEDSQARILALPSTILHDEWDSLVFDDALPSRLLRCLVRMVNMTSQPGLKLSTFNWNRLCLLHGPPGSGKSTLCRALAQKLSIRLGDVFTKCMLVEINTNSMLSKYFGQSGKLIAATFERIRDLAQDPDSFICVVMDEVESVCGTREKSTSGVECSDGLRATNQLLTALDGLRKLPNVIVLCTSNLIDAIDPAFLDRVDIKQLVPSPSPAAIYNIFRSCLNELVRSSLVDPISVPIANDSEPTTPSKAASKPDPRSTRSGKANTPAKPPSNPTEPWTAVAAPTIPTFAYMKVFHSATSTSLGSRVWEVSQKCEGFSGRTLRRLPILGLAMYTWGGSCLLGDAVSALEAAVDQEVLVKERKSGMVKGEVVMSEV